MKTLERLGLGGMMFHVAPAVELDEPEVGFAPVASVLGFGVAKARGLEAPADYGREVPAAAQAVVIQDGVLEVDVVFPGAVAADGDAAEAGRVDAE